jgi:hypothetical protein
LTQNAADCNTYNLTLSLSSEENELRRKAESAYERFATQIRTFKLEAQRQADECAKTKALEISRSAEADAQVSMHEDDKDADGEVEEESVQHAKGKHTIARGRKLVSFRFFPSSLSLLIPLFAEDWSHECG